MSLWHMANVADSDIVLSVFELQSRYFVHFASLRSSPFDTMWVVGQADDLFVCCGA